jgi:hypothetical protein
VAQGEEHVFSVFNLLLIFHVLYFLFKRMTKSWERRGKMLAACLECMWKHRSIVLDLSWHCLQITFKYSEVRQELTISYSTIHWQFATNPFLLPFCCTTHFHYDILSSNCLTVLQVRQVTNHLGHECL